MFFVSWDGGRTLHVLRADNTVFPLAAQTVAAEATIDSKAISLVKKTKGAARGQLGSIVRLEGTAPNHSSWIQLAGIAKRYPGLHVVAVISPNKTQLGAGQSPDPDYANGIRLLKANNITVLGALDTHGGKRSEGEIKNQIEHWKIVYNDIDGIFLNGAFDMEREGHEGYYRDIDNYIKKDMGMNFTVANVGKPIPESYAARTDVDVFIICSDTGYPTISSIRNNEWIHKYPQTRFGIIASSVPQFAIDLRNFINLAVGSPSERAIGYVYAHPEHASRISDSLSPLFEVGLMELAKINQTSDAARVPPPTVQEVLDPKEPLKAKEFAGYDKYGITKIYPTRYGEDSSGESFQNQIWGGEGNRAIPRNNKRFVEIPSKDINSKWTNVEITSYVRLVKIGVHPYVISHEARTQYPLKHESEHIVSYGGVLYANGQCFVSKRLEGKFGGCPPRGIASASDKDLKGSWIGFKSIFYNRTETGNSKPTVMAELWVDENVDDGRGNLMIKNDWRQISVVKDAGGWLPEHDNNKEEEKGKKKKGKKTNKKTKKHSKEDTDRILTEGTNFVVFEIPEDSEVMLNMSSVREIIGPGLD